MAFTSSGFRWAVDRERGVTIRLAIPRGHLRIKGSPQIWRVKLEYLTQDGLKFSAPYFMRTAHVPLAKSSAPAEVTSVVLLNRQDLLSRYREALTNMGKEPPTDADIEQICRDVQEAIVARERGLHSDSPTVPPVKVLFVPTVQSDQAAVRLLDAVATADRL